ncbi:hypothetical protein [Massilia putida]|uniref:hypothetical protein n=1 Tax=Massilia putida TaxID=1141883 RepID=UPI0012EB1FD3|nr:hypothetical protein [Massilia putida]
MNIHKYTRHQGMIVNVSRFLKRLIAGDHVVGSSAASLRNVVVWLFIALVAMFLTHPSSPASAFDAPVPWPAELGLDGNFGM